ncbi:MAG: hypothetical protein WC382_08335 [Methanoregulaceae archaeon]
MLLPTMFPTDIAGLFFQEGDNGRGEFGERCTYGDKRDADDVGRDAEELRHPTAETIRR